jgi:hypothetical protein
VQPPLCGTLRHIAGSATPLQTSTP